MLDKGFWLSASVTVSILKKHRTQYFNTHTLDHIILSIRYGSYHMIRDVHAHFDLLTPKELSAHTYRVDRVDVTDKHRHHEKKIFRAKGHFRTFFQKKFFRCSVAKMDIKRLHFSH